MALTDEQKSKYINLGGLSAFWVKAKEYIDNKISGLPNPVTGFKANVTGATNYSGLISATPDKNTTGDVTLSINVSTLDNKLKSLEDGIKSIEKIASDDDINAIFS
jgi:hypothetical protein